MSDRIEEIVVAWRERIDRGEATEPEDLIRAHPDLADELRAHFAALRLFESSVAQAPEAPSRIGEYAIVREIGRGGMGVVYEAEQISMRRKVALKVLFPSVTSTPDAVKRFCREAWAAGRVKHTNIVAVHQLGQERGTWYCAMELVEGRPLNQVIDELRSERRSLRESRLARRARGVPTPSPIAAQTATGTRAYYLRVAEMFAEVAEALQLAHDHGIVHRDVKPSNLLLDAEGRLKLVDFGLARLQDAAATVTRTGDIVGTPLYMSPEQVTGVRDMDGRTDVYSLGATLYETLTLRPPFTAATVAGLAAEVIGREPSAPRRCDSHIPKDLETIALKALEKEPARRYRTAGDLARDLRAFVHGGVVQARRVGPIGRLARRVRRNKVRAALAAATLIAASAATFYAIEQRRERERRADLEYDRLCLEADQVAARATSWAESGDRMTAAYVGPGPGLFEILDEAIRIRPGRPEAYFMRAIAPGRTRDERLADLEAARAGGLAERSWRLAKADILLDAGRGADAEAEERLASKAGPADASTLLAEGLLARRRGDRKRAQERLSDSLASADAPPSVRCRALWWRSVVLQEAGDLGNALADLHALRIWTGDTVIAAIRMASLHRRLGHDAESEGLFAGALQHAVQRGNEAALVRLADLCFSSREYSWMERVAEAGILRYPDSARLRCRRGSALDSLGRREEALAECERATELEPRCASAHSDRGAALAKLGRLEEALAACERAIELGAKNAATHNIVAYALFRAGRRDPALAAVERALEIDPKYAMAHISRGTILRDLGRTEEALTEFDRALELDAMDAMAHTNRGCVLMSLGRSEEAVAACDRALELDANYAPAHQNRGGALLKLGRSAEALAEFDRAIELDPTVNRAALFDDMPPAMAHSNRGLALLNLGRLDEALAACDRALALDPKFALAHAARAMALSGLGRNAEALKAYESASELMPWDARPLNCSAWLRATCPDSTVRDAAKAVDLAGRAVRLAPREGNYWNTFGVALCRAGKWADALEALDKSTTLRNGGDAFDWFFAAMAKWHLGRKDDARALYDRAVAWMDERAPKDEDLRRFRDEAATLLGLKP